MRLAAGSSDCDSRRINSTRYACDGSMSIPMSFQQAGWAHGHMACIVDWENRERVPASHYWARARTAAAPYDWSLLAV